MSTATHIQNIALIGGTGQVGSHMLKSLLATGKHTVTALTRAEASTEFPSAVKVAKVDYSSSKSITEALRGQDLLIISLSTGAPQDLHSRICDAAAAAGVKWILPNYYGYALSERTGGIPTDPISAQFSRFIDDVRKHDSEGVKFLALCCGFWYEFSLGMGPQWYGFDIPNKKVTFYDNGTKKINTSTWELCGDAVAKVLSLPIEKQNGELALSDWANGGIYISSFLISQREMLDSLHRVLGTKDEDWEITYQPTKERYEEGMKEVQSGDRMGFAKAMYSLGFYPEGRGDFETGFGLDNEKLGLQKEDLDAVTKRAVDMVKGGFGITSWAK